MSITFLLGHPDGSHAHTRADAHARNTNLLTAALQLVQQRADLAGAGAAERVAEGDGAALRVDLLLGDAELVGAPEALAGEGLVDLEDVDVGVGEAAGELVDLGDGLPRALAHEQGLDAGDAGGDVLAEDGLAQLLGRGALHQQHGGGAVRDLRGVARVDGAALGEGRADLAQALGGDARAHAVVFAHGHRLGLAALGVRELHGQRVDFLVEEAGLLRLERLLVRRRGEGVLVRARDLEIPRHVLRQHAHGHLAVRGFGVRFEELGELGDGRGAVVDSLVGGFGDVYERERKVGRERDTYPYCKLMLSTPAPMPTSIMPARIWLATSTQACRPEEHWRLRVRTAVDSGKPATRTAARISVAPPPGASTSPTHTSSTSAGSILERSIRPFSAPAIRSAAWVSLNPPLPPFVNAVRRHAVTTICMRRGAVSFARCSEIAGGWFRGD